MKVYTSKIKSITSINRKVFHFEKLFSIVKNKAYIVASFCILFLNSFNAIAQNYALTFDGVDDQVSITSSSALNNPGNNLTVEAWIYPTSFASGGTYAGPVIDKEDDAANDAGYALRVGGTGQFEFVIGNGNFNYSSVTSPANTLVLNKWQHIAGTYDGTVLRIYLNGTLVNSHTTAANTNIGASTVNMLLGGWASGTGRHFHGMIDEARVWTAAHIAEQIQENRYKDLPISTPNLIAYWQMNQSSGIITVASSIGPSGAMQNFTGNPWMMLDIFNTWQKSLWLKANEGATNSGANLTGWTDQTGASTFSVVGTPGYQTNLFNFNPGVTFNNTDVVTDLPTSYVHGTTSITYQDGFAVYQKNSGTDGGAVVGSYTKPPGVNYGVAIFAGESPNDSYVGNGIVGNYGRFTNTKLATEIGLVNHDVSLAGSPYSTARYNGLTQTMTPTGPGFNSVTFIPVIGGSKGDWKHMRGKVAEVVLYSSSLSAADKLKIESYLALKYGISLDPSVANYVSSAGTVLWDNTTYWNDVFGIGKDVGSGLNQTSSNSINTGSGDGTGQSGKGNIVLSNPTSLADGDFLMIGHDNAALTVQSTDLPSSLTGFNRIAREWKVKRTGDVGTTNLIFDKLGLPVGGVAASDFKLLIDTDGDGDFTTGTVTVIDANLLLGSGVTFSAISLPNNAVFTFVTGTSVGPGVLGASLWLKANEGITNSGANLTGWTDQTGASTFSVVGTPGYQTNLFNFNPGVTFNNTDLVTDLPSSYVHGTTPITYQDGFAVYQKNSGTDGGAVVGSYTKPPGVNYGVAIFAGESPNDSYVGNGIVGNYGRFTNTKLATEIGLVNHDVSLAGSPYSTARYNGLTQTMTPTGPGFNSVTFIPVIGGSKGDWKHMRGKVAEVVLFPSSLSAADKLKVESYLAVKYGISLDPSVSNYVSSAGTVLWNNTTYWNDVFGIGKDDGSGLNQTSSNSINTGSGDGTGQSGKGNIVLSNPTSLADGDFLMIGHDNGALTVQLTDLPSSLTGFNRIAREWKVKRTGDVGTTNLIFDKLGLPVGGVAASDFKLLIDTDGDGDFTTGTVTVIDANLLLGSGVTFSAISLPNNAVFTFVTGTSVGPGVLGANLWLKANEGTTNIGTNLTGWTDQTGTNTFTVNGTPGFSSNAINFNPAVSIDNSQANTALPTTYLSGNSTLSYVDGFAVFKKTNTGSGALIGSSLTTNNYGAAIFSGESDNQLWVGSGTSFAYQHFTNTALTTGKTVIANFDVSPVSATGRLNGVSQTISNGTGAEYANINFIPWIGGTNNSGSTFGWKHFRGQVAEMVLFPSSLSAADKLKIESYLALKYGITLDVSVANYVNSAGNTVWNNTTYWNNVFGIGKDDDSGLNQSQSNSINTGSGDGTGQSGTGNIVLSNPSALATGNFLIIGHDNAALTEISTDVPSSFGNCKNRLAREWKVKHTGNVGTIQLSFNWNGITVNGGVPTIPSEFYLIIDTDGDGDFATGTQIINNTGTFSSTNVLSYNGVTLNDGAVFTFGISKTSTWTGTTSTNWSVASNWASNTLPTASNCVIIPNTTNQPFIPNGYQAVAGNIIIENGATLTVNSDGFLTVTDAVTVNTGGDLILQDKASLVQINNVTNTGEIHLTRTTPLKDFDYVYWSSPVSSFNVNAISPLTTLAPELKWEPTIVTNLPNNYGNWVNTSENMVVGRGYAVRAPDGYPITPTPFTTVFEGTPNNGNITIPISRGTYDGPPYDNDGNPATADATHNDDNFNLIGNPYPSAISALAFLSANPNVDGFVNIWTHSTLPSSAITSPFYSGFVYNYSPTDYVTYNRTGQSSGPGSFNGNIASGQAFFVLMKSNTASTTENVTFTNVMRSPTYDNDHFFRSPSDEGRIWLDIVAQDNSHLRTLVAYVDGATNSIDRDYDAITDKKPIVNIFSICEGKEFKIQGRSTPLNQDDVVPIGVTVPVNGSHHIAIASLNGIFLDPSQDVYLEDLLLNSIHNLKTNPYNFSAPQGTIENRFILKFKNTLSNPNNDLLNDKVIAVYGEQIAVKSQNQLIQSIRVFDVLGREIKEYDAVDNQTLFLKDLPKNNDLKILKVTLENQTVVTLKVIY